MTFHHSINLNDTMQYKFTVGQVVRSTQYPAVILRVFELDTYRDYPNYRVEDEKGVFFYQEEGNLYIPK